MSFRNTRIFLITITAIALAWSLPASADVNGAEAFDSPWYLGISLTNGTYTLENVVEADISTFDFRLGREFNEYFSVEGRLGIGFNEDSISGCVYEGGQLVCSNSRVRISEHLGVYARGELFPDSFVQPYAVVGFANTTTTVQIDVGLDTTAKRTSSGLSYGVGIAAGGDRFKFFAEYISLFDKDGETADGLGFGVTIGF